MYYKDVWIVKTRINGGVEWEKTHGGPYMEMANDISPAVVAGGISVALLTTAFGLVVCWFGLVQQSFTTWSVESTSYQLCQLENIAPTAQVFVDYFGCALPEPSVIPDPLTGIFWLCILVFILVPTWQTK